MKAESASSRRNCSYKGLAQRPNCELTEQTRGLELVTLRTQEQRCTPQSHTPDPFNFGPVGYYSYDRIGANTGFVEGSNPWTRAVERWMSNGWRDDKNVLSCLCNIFTVCIAMVFTTIINTNIDCKVILELHSKSTSPFCGVIRHCLNGLTSRLYLI